MDKWMDNLSPPAAVGRGSGEVSKKGSDRGSDERQVTRRWVAAGHCAHEPPGNLQLPGMAVATTRCSTPSGV